MENESPEIWEVAFKVEIHYFGEYALQKNSHTHTYMFET